MDKRLNDLDRSLQLLLRDQSFSTEQLKSLLNMNLQQKVDYRDLDTLTHSLHGKADLEKVQELVSHLRSELVTQLSLIKKDVSLKTKKKDDDLKNKK